jgi:hypothetical protein
MKDRRLAVSVQLKPGGAREIRNPKLEIRNKFQNMEMCKIKKKLGNFFA